MILRRVTEHVKAQNWTAIAIDFVIVVMGVFIGIQVANWNDARSDRRREMQILRDIATDLRRDIDGYEVSIEGTMDKIAAITFILDNAPVASGKNLSAHVEINGFSYENFLASESQAGARTLDERAATFDDEFWSYAVLVSNAQPAATAFDSLVSAGELGILRNASLVQSLQEYRQLTEALEKSQDVTFRPRRDNAIDIGVKYGLSPFHGIEKDEFFALVAANPELAATVQAQLGWAQGHLTMLAAASQSAKTLLKKIESESGIRSADVAAGVAR